MCFEDSSPQGQPQPTPYPALPSAMQLTQDATNAQATAAPQTLAINQATLPGYAQLFTDINRTQAPQNAATYTGIQQLYGPQLAAAMTNAVKTLDPTGFAVREGLGNSVMGDLSLGGELSPEELTAAQNDIRSGQVARGGGTGVADAIAEARQLNLDRFGRKSARQNAAASFVNGRTVEGLGTVTAPVSSPNVSPFAVQSPTTQSIMGAQQNNNELQANEIGMMNNLNESNWQYRDQNTSNPFLQGLAGFGGFASGIIGAAAGGGGAGFSFGDQLMQATNGTGQQGIDSGIPSSGPGAPMRAQPVTGMAF